MTGLQLYTLPWVDRLETTLNPKLATVGRLRCCDLLELIPEPGLGRLPSPRLHRTQRIPARMPRMHASPKPGLKRNIEREREREREREGEGEGEGERERQKETKRKKEIVNQHPWHLL